MLFLKQLSMIFGKREISKSPCIGIMIDESSDISTSKNLIVYISYVYQGMIKTRYVHF